MIEADIRNHLDLERNEPDSQDTLLIASRLLLLAGALIDIATPAEQSTTTP
jgi:hypothetical protein